MKNPVRLGSWTEHTVLPVVALIAGLALVGTIATTILHLQTENVEVRIDESYGTMMEIERFMSAVRSAESEQRGFLLTGDPSFQETYLRYLRNARFSLTSLAAKSRGSGSAHGLLNLLEVLFSKKEEVMLTASTLRTQEGVYAAIRYFELGEGPRLTTEMEDVTARMRQIELRSLVSWQQRAGRFSSLVLGGTLMISILSATALVAGAFSVRRELVARRKEALAESQARAAAEESTRMKSQFLANMSHEIRTPMNGIIGTASLFAETKMDPSQKEFLGVIQRSSESLLMVLNDILDFSKMEAGYLRLETHPVVIQDLIHTAVETVAPLAGQKGIELLVMVDDDLPVGIVADPLRLKQILVNLTSNAVKFTHEGEVSVHVTACRASEPGRDGTVCLRFAIKDTGIGISEDYKAKLFQPFSQADPSISRKFGGTGLGLAITHSLVDLMKGKIGVESQVGKGSLFWVEIPFVPADIPQVPDDHAGQLAGKKLLGLDDNPTNLFLLRKMAEPAQMQIECFDTPARALAALQAGNHYDAALIDYQMPEMDGITWAKEAKNTEAGKKLPLLLLTSAAPEINAEDGFSHLFASVMAKPIRVKSLRDNLAHLFASHQEPARQPKNTEGEEVSNSLRILVAEDDPVNQVVISRMLSALGCQNFEIALNGREAVDKCINGDFQVVLMDVQMPVLDGIAATREIRKFTGSGTEPHIIAITANAMVGDREVALESGMNDYLSKPMRLADLRNAIAKAQLSPTAEGPAG